MVPLDVLSAHYVTADLGFHHAILLATGNDLLAQLGSIMENALRERDALVYGDGCRFERSVVR